MKGVAVFCAMAINICLMFVAFGALPVPSTLACFWIAICNMGALICAVTLNKEVNDGPAPKDQTRSSISVKV